MTFFVITPMVNVNEEEARLVEWFKSSGDYVHPGELLCSLETTKSIFELNAEEEGFFVPLVDSNMIVRTGQVIAVLTAEKGANYQLPQKETAPEISGQTKFQDSRRWTKKAEIIAVRNHLQLDQLAGYFSTQELITEQNVLDYLTKNINPEQESISLLPNPFHNQRILIIGAGNVAALVLDILTRTPNQTAIGLVDDDPKTHDTEVMGYRVFGDLNQVTRLWHEKAFDAAALAVGTLPARADIYERFVQEGIPFTNIIDPNAIIGTEASMGNGNMIMAFCRLGPQCRIGNNNFLSAFVNIEHHNVMGDHCTFGPNVFMSGGVQIGNRVRFGTGISIEPRLSIGNNVTIASGVILTTHVPANVVVRSKTNFSIHTSIK